MFSTHIMLDCLHCHATNDAKRGTNGCVFIVRCKSCRIASVVPPARKPNQARRMSINEIWGRAILDEVFERLGLAPVDRDAPPT